MKQLQTTEAQHLLQALDLEIRSRGRGAIRAVERDIGYSEGWWQHRVASGDISLHQLLSVLSSLGLDPIGFMRRSLSAEESLELDQPTGESPSLVLNAVERFQTGRESHGVGPTYLETLDQRRYHDPREVLAQAEWAVDLVELKLLPTLLGIVGSAWRRLFRLNEAEHAIRAGITMAEEQGEAYTVARLLQRLSYVIDDREDRQEALRLSEKVTIMYLRLDATEEVGTALVDQGIWLHSLKRFEESIATHQSALRYLATEAHRNRCAVYQYFGLNHRELGRPRRALEFLDKAEQAAAEGDIGLWAHSKLLWLRARISADLGNLSLAEELFLTIVQNFRELHPGETALATCELVRVYLMQNRPEKAYGTATSMRALLEPLKNSRVISTAIGDLLRSGQTGLTFVLLKQVMSRIEDERQDNRMRWQSLVSVS